MAAWLLPALTAGASILGKVFGGASKGAQDSRVTTNQQQSQQYGQEQDNYRTQQQALLSLLGLTENAAMDRYKTGLTAPQNYAQNSVMGDRLANAKPISISHPRANIPTITGGFGPQDLSQNTRQMGQQMSKDALMGMMGGAPAMPNTQGALLTPPTSPNYQNSPSGTENALSIGGLIASILGGVGEAYQTGKKTSTPTPTSGGYKLQW